MPLTLPANFYGYFWDVDTKALNPSRKPLFVIQRLLDKGNAEGVSWVLQNFDQETIKKAFTTLRDFNPKIALYWKNYLHIPRKDMPSLQKEYLRIRRSHWPY